MTLERVFAVLGAVLGDGWSHPLWGAGSPWPTGSARIRLTVRADAAGTRVGTDEYADSGPVALVPRAERHLAIAPRNRESPARLAAVATRRGGPGSTS
ncbi:MAG: hypothetical protein ABS81_14280 [Pseudonocardia sp. SCN 72-86]|nr:MAG: hypothetical protein ABS81_14280 [Pseudonocardia sp. SCN 72-86]